MAVATSEETDFDGALNIFLQSHSLGPLAPNIVLSGWPVNEDRIEAFFRHLNTIRLLRMNILALINPERASDEPGDGPIDIWWRGRQNGSLMLILAHLLTCSGPWRKTRIRLLRLSDPENRPEAERELAQFRLYDYVVVNDDLELAARNLEALLVSFKLRTALIPEDRTPWKKP